MGVYKYYILAMIILNGLIWVTPLLEMCHNPISVPIFSSFSLICNQLPERSLCLSKSFSIGDCSSISGYQFPVCSRCMAIYLAMLIGGLALPFIYDKNSKKTPSFWILILACIPIAIDGGTQLFGWRESTNLLRIITGSIIGLVIPFFLVPLLNDFIYVLSKRKSVEKESNRGSQRVNSRARK